MKTKAHSVAASLIVFVIVCGATGFFPGAARADSLLTGTVTSAAGEKMGGVTVSAKARRLDRSPRASLPTSPATIISRHCRTASTVSGRKR